jgi:hypothetical protein
MTDPLGDSLRAGMDPVRLTLPSAEVVRRNAERRRGKRRRALTVTAVGAAVGVVIAGSSQVSQMWRPEPADVVTIDPGSSEAPLMLSEDPFLLVLDVDLVRTDAAPTSLSTCISSPLRWGAAEYGGVRYATPRQATPVFNEFVLRYDTAVEAHRAVTDAWRQFARCPRPAEVATDPLTAPKPSPIYDMDEWFANQRATFASAQMRGQPVHLYALRVGRRENVVVVIEDLGVPTDRANLLLEKALTFATRTSPN